MALTTFTNRTLAVNFTQQQLYDEVKAAMLVAGFGAPIDENGSAGSNMEVVYSVTYNAATKGTVFLRIQLTTGLVLTSTLFDTYNTTTNIGTNGSSSPLIIPTVSTSTLLILTVNNPEMRGICFRNGTTEHGFLGIIRPEVKIAEWNENLWPYAFVLSATTFQLRTTTVLPPNYQTTYNFGPNSANGISVVNSLTGKPEIFPFGILLGTSSSSNTSIYTGTFSSDIGIVQGAGRLQGDTFDNKWIYLGRNICHRYAN